jgi:kynurenine formamidase
VVTVEDFDTLAAKVSYWGRWGDQDQRGSLNFITPQTVARAVASVVTGETFSLSMELSLDGPQNGVGVPGRINPVRTMLAINTPMLGSADSIAYSDDIVVTPTQAATHWDALAHCSHRGRMYNGFPADLVTPAGAAKLGIEAMGTVLSRGVLLDVARHQGVDSLPEKFPITRAVLEEVEQAQGQRVEEGDIVVVRTGLMRHFLAGDTPSYRRNVAALEYDAPLFLHERGAAALAIDNMPVELLPATVDEVAMPVHILCLVMMGLPLGENWVLEDLSAACAQDRRYAFLLSASPERFRHSTGGMVHPVAVR